MVSHIFHLSLATNTSTGLTNSLKLGQRERERDREREKWRDSTGPDLLQGTEEVADAARGQSVMLVTVLFQCWTCRPLSG